MQDWKCVSQFSASCSKTNTPDDGVRGVTRVFEQKKQWLYMVADCAQQNNPWRKHMLRFISHEASTEAAWRSTQKSPETKNKNKQNRLVHA